MEDDTSKLSPKELENRIWDILEGQKKSGNMKTHDFLMDAMSDKEKGLSPLDYEEWDERQGWRYESLDSDRTQKEYMRIWDAEQAEQEALLRNAYKNQ
jgi:hypothetical protein